ncbi:hypothetical protein [Escherichia coli]|uniref:hypothetical protein n=1 Tax=Escherichia coli TaxID=562 RepID=UPI00235A3CE0|nr:hypothetical protein [Escherichia coli]MDC9111681.1 hypothetical protein [Escherichia coli]
MCNNTRPDAAAEAIKTLMHALIDISVIAVKAHKHATSETEYAGAFVPHSLAVMQFSADMALGRQNSYRRYSGGAPCMMTVILNQ